MQGEAAQPKAKRDKSQTKATKIIFKDPRSFSNIIFRQKLLKNFRGRYSRYKWFIGTYHVYKKLSSRQRAKVDRLSYITDILRKYYPKGTKLYMTREMTSDGYPHYHYFLGLEKDAWGSVIKQKTVRNTKLWTREWKLGETFNYHDPSNEDNEINPFYVNSRLHKLDMGARQRWFKYGVWQYLLYIFKYSTFKKFHDYFIMN